MLVDVYHMILDIITVNIFLDKLRSQVLNKIKEQSIWISRHPLKEYPYKMLN